MACLTKVKTRHIAVIRLAIETRKTMLESSDYPFASEFYTVEKSVEVYVNIKGESERIRIDALKGKDGYSTRAYIERQLMVQPALPRAPDGTLSAKEEVRQWVDYDLPWTRRDKCRWCIGSSSRLFSGAVRQAG